MKSKEISKESRTCKLWFWRISCVTLLLLFIAMGIKSNFFNRILYRLEITDDYRDAAFWAKRGWTNTLKKMNVDADIVFFGNSITCGSSFHEYFTDKKIVNLGYPGDDIQGMINRVEQVRCVQPEKIFLMGGINGLKYTSEQKFKDKYSELVDSMLTIVASKNLYLQSILPISKNKGDNNSIIRFNGIIKDIATQKQCTYIDLHSLYYIDREMGKEFSMDGVHLKKEGYVPWTEMIKPYIYQ